MVFTQAQKHQLLRPAGIKCQGIVAFTYGGPEKSNALQPKQSPAKRKMLQNQNKNQKKVN